MKWEKDILKNIQKFSFMQYFRYFFNKFLKFLNILICLYSEFYLNDYDVFM